MYIYIYMYTYAYIYIHIFCTYIYISIYICIYAYTYAYIYIYTYIYIYIFFFHVCIHMHVYSYKYTYMYIYTCIHGPLTEGKSCSELRQWKQECACLTLARFPFHAGPNPSDKRSVVMRRDVWSHSTDDRSWDPSEIEISSHFTAQKTIQKFYCCQTTEKL